MIDRITSHWQRATDYAEHVAVHHFWTVAISFSLVILPAIVALLAVAP